MHRAGKVMPCARSVLRGTSATPQASSLPIRACSYLQYKNVRPDCASKSLPSLLVCSAHGSRLTAFHAGLLASTQCPLPA